ncbi:tripartite tricarboxylate transporter permease [Paracoccus thiocyanatus]|uniref:DUF112 domain-containing protein n=1 Tax=Paracoccus thiocyanatus TaxID=34006 RepID=A0A3D8PC52_9RHOB|nr:tripartite tricarboxylate transporter permease [Paracoccus thiocyanatus]RDW12898.1 hypothetical protein DIE28_11055 [Paracoccus thiocyanatus]
METLFSNLAMGFATSLTLGSLMWCFAGVFLGTFTGVLPGIGAMAAISMILPITFYLDPTHALVMLAGIFYGAEYGGSIASILLNLPGTTSSAVTCLDGNPMAKQGRAGVALLVTAVSSFVGGTIGILAIMLLSGVIAQFALSFGPADYFSAMLLGLIAASTMTQDLPVKSVSTVVLGLLLGCIGADVETGIARYTFGSMSLYDGLSIVAMAMGLFGIPEIIGSLQQGEGHMIQNRVTLNSMIPTRKEARQSVGPTLRGSFLGLFFGALPGTGLSVASFIAYALEKRLAKDKSRFGKGAIEGIAAPEAANNAAAQASFIPTLSLGIPGSATMALMLGALMIHGIAPGPGLMRDHPELFWGLITSFWIGNLLLLVLNIPLIGMWVRLLQIPFHYMFPAVIGFVCIGVMSATFNTFDVGVLLAFGMLGFFMRALDYSPAPLLLGFILGPLMEENLRRALVFSRGDYSVFVTQPISATFLLVTLLLVLLMIATTIWSRRHAVRLAQAEEF